VGLSGIAAAVKAKFTTVQTPLGASTLEAKVEALSAYHHD
jgi:hypothetical protein